MEIEETGGSIEVVADSINYRVFDGNFSIVVKVCRNGKMTIVPKDSMKNTFVFQDSDPKVVRAMACLLFKASSLKCDIPDISS